MRIACITTTINVPHVLALYAKYGPDVMFFVIGDRKTPDEDVVVFLQENVPNHAYYGIDAQYKLGYKCARLIPENCIQRRNIGFLEALKWGADIVVSIDDDNIPIGDYFSTFQKFCGASIQASAASGWFDVGEMLSPRASHRGFPRIKKSPLIFNAAIAGQIGVFAGICLGDPDIDAVERIANGPTVHGVSEILRSGVVVDPKSTWTVFNSQNTAVVRELVPAWFMIPFIGRADDIFASLIVQRVMRETGLYTHFGSPFVFQQRNQHDLLKDLVNELLCMQQVLPLAKWLNDYLYMNDDKSVLSRVRRIWEGMSDNILPAKSIDAAKAWCDDCEAVMK